MEERELASYGLTEEEARIRRQQGKGNVVSDSGGKSNKQIVVEHLLTYFNLVFGVLAALLIISGSNVKNLTFLVVVVINTAIGAVQQIKAKRAVEKLTLVAAQKVNVLRDGRWVKLRDDLLVEGDVVSFSAGDQICADGEVLWGSIQANESLLTGESDAVHKQCGSEVLSGSFVLSGKAAVKLTNVGDYAFAAKLAREAKKDHRATKSEMMRSLDKLIRVLGIILIPVGLILFYHHSKELHMAFRQNSEKTVAALVGMIPEGLYLLTSLAMARSAIKLTKQRVLVQDMNCIETLSRVDVLCVDKTGTITEPTMVAEEVYPIGDTDPEEIEGVLCALYGGREPDNDTARAINELFPDSNDWKCLEYIPFDSKYKWSGGVFEDHGSFLVGAPDRIMGERYEEVQESVEAWIDKGFRVLLVARYEGVLKADALRDRDMVPLALILLTNRIRENAPSTFRYFKEQGVTIKVISGDNPRTAADVAQRAGIENAQHYIDATRLKTNEEIDRAVQEYTVFGRVTPEMKKKLVIALKAQGHTVAMTGDGVNDVLAMKQADCAISMASGSQAASQVARLVLTDSDFGAMPGIVAEGRRVINNIQRAATLFLVKNILSLTLALACVIGGWIYPFEPIQMTLISSLTIGLPGFFLAMEPNYERVKGRFLPTVLRQALPGGLTDFIVSALACAMISAFKLPAQDAGTVCTAVLSGVALFVLYKVCTPFDRFRKFVWGAVAVALLGCFILLPHFFSLRFTDHKSILVLLAALIMVPTVFYSLQWLFSQWDKLVAWIRRKK